MNFGLVRPEYFGRRWAHITYHTNKHHSYLDKCKTHQFVLLAWCGIVAHFWDQLHIAFMSLNKLKNNFVSFSR